MMSSVKTLAPPPRLIQVPTGMITMSRPTRGSTRAWTLSSPTGERIRISSEFVISNARAVSTPIRIEATFGCSRLQHLRQQPFLAEIGHESQRKPGTFRRGLRSAPMNSNLPDLGRIDLIGERHHRRGGAADRSRQHRFHGYASWPRAAQRCASASRAAFPAIASPKPSRLGQLLVDPEI